MRRGFVVHGADGLDEISNTGETVVAEVDRGQVTMKTLRPEEFGIPRCSLSDLQGGDVAENVQIIQSVLEGRTGPRRDVVLLNAAAPWPPPAAPPTSEPVCGWLLNPSIPAPPSASCAPWPSSATVTSEVNIGN